MARSRILAPLSLLAACAFFWANGPSPSAAADPFQRAKVQLYSGGKVVGEWEAVGPGRLEGDSFVFPVRVGVQDLDVRIAGTFSFVPKP